MIPLADTKGSGSFPFWTVVIIIINLVAFFVEFISPDHDLLIAQYALIPAKINLADFATLYPFITSQFLHAGIFHIASNMWFLWIFGNNVEERFGPIFFPIIYLLSGMVGGLAQYFFLPDSTVPILGASGAVAGILGTYFVFFPRHTIKTIIPIFGFFTIADIPASLMLIYWFVTQIFNGSAALVTTSYQLGGVAYFAHIAGFLFGYLIAKIWKGNSSTQVLEGFSG